MRADIADGIEALIGVEDAYVEAPDHDPPAFEAGHVNSFADLDPAALFCLWFNDVGHEADTEVLRQEYPDLASFESCLRGHGWKDSSPASGAGGYPVSTELLTRPARSRATSRVEPVSW